MANFVGDISKTLFGTLHEGNLTQINNEFDNLYKDNENIASVLTNHTKILKLILDSSLTNHESLMLQENQERAIARNSSNGINKAIQENFINSKLVLAAVLINEINEDINMAINAINDGKHGIIHPQILTPAMLKETIKEFENNQRTRYNFNNSEDNFQNIIDISTLSVVIIGGLFTYILEIPILDKEEGTLLHLIPIPHLYQ